MNRNGRYSTNIYLRRSEVIQKISDDIFELKSVLFDLFSNAEPVVARAEIIDNTTGQVIHQYSKDIF